MLRRAIKEYAPVSHPSQRDLVIHALSAGGGQTSGALPDLKLVASYIDYNNKDGCQKADVERVIGLLVEESILALEEDGTLWRLLRPFP
jgi:hypothetical protein